MTIPDIVWILLGGAGLWVLFDWLNVHTPLPGYQ